MSQTRESIFKKNHCTGNPTILYKTLILGLVIIVTLIVLNLNARPVYADSITADDLITAVNQMRVSAGLPAYTVNPDLNDFARAYSDFGAFNGCDHFNHLRSDGSYAYFYRIYENIDCGANLTVADVLEKWNNTLNLYTLLGLQDARIGAAVSVVGDEIFVVVDVKANLQSATPTVMAAGESAATKLPDGMILTSTPNSDGSIWHIVGNGESIVKIAAAYGLTQAQLQTLNELNSSVYLYAGQKLLIKAANPATASPTVTVTQPSATPTATATAVFKPAASRTLRPATQTSSPTPIHTFEQSPTPAAAQVLKATGLLFQELSSRQILGLILVIGCGIGLIVLGVLRNKTKKQ